MTARDMIREARGEIDLMRTVLILATLFGLTACETRPPFDRVSYNLALDADKQPTDLQRYAWAMRQRGAQWPGTPGPSYSRRQ
jgi:hypothetical protein